MALNFTEWSREAKDEFAQKRMEEMKLKNEALKQRYAEVEQDRIKAEAKDSAVTSLKISKKENIAIKKKEEILKVEREWDKGKVDQDADDWNPPKFFGYRSRMQRRNFQDRSSPKKENWRVRSANVGKDRQSYSKFKSSGPNHKYQESNNYGTSGFRNENSSFSRQKDKAHRASGGTYRSFQNSRFDFPSKKMGTVGSCSSSSGDIESGWPPSKEEMDWRCVGMSENQQKQSRVAKWVKAINTASSWNEEYNNVKGNDYYEKRSEGKPRDIVKTYGYTNEEGYFRKNQSSRDQTHLKNRERYDGLKYGPSSRGNSRARGNKTPTGERTIGGFEDKNQRDFRKRNYSDKNKFRRESDYHSNIKEKFNKTASDYSGRREDAECKPKYDFLAMKRSFTKKSTDYSDITEYEERSNKYNSEKRPFDKQSSARNYGEDKFRKSKNVQSPTISSSQDRGKKVGFDEYKNLERCPSCYPNSSRFDDQYVNNRVSERKKLNKYNTESKFKGQPGKIENESTTDYQASTASSLPAANEWSRLHPDLPVVSSVLYEEESSDDEYYFVPPRNEATVWSDYVQRYFGSFEASSSITEFGDEDAVFFSDDNEKKGFKSVDASSSATKTMEDNPEFINDDNEQKGFKSVDASSSATKTMEDNPEFINDDNEQKGFKSVDASSSATKTMGDNPAAIKGDYEEKCKSVDTNLCSVPYEDDPDSTWANYEQTCFDSVDNSSFAFETMKDNPKDIGDDYLQKCFESVDASSSAAETTMENNFETIMDDYKQNTLLNIERNDNQTECKCNLMKEEIDRNKVSLSLDWSTPVMTDCDTSCEKLFYENSELKSYEVCGHAVSELHDSNVDESDNIESTCRNEIEKHDAAVDCNVTIDDVLDYSNDSVEYSGDQYEGDITEVQQLISDLINITVDSCEGKNSITNGSNSSLLEISIIEDSQNTAVQSTETELSCKLHNPESSDLETTQEKINLNEISSVNIDCETSTKQAVENDKAEIVRSEVTALSSQSMTATCIKFDSESEFKSSDLVTANSQFPKRQGNGIENSSGALNLSDEGGWSTVSEDENVSGDDKNNKDGNPAKTIGC
ncbi:uncharacterized protein LOC129958953 [Argiope bruennichi]|uniref:uncharacterized protein LOC129958953 n=1 Tax=Argiope bruennichi TaxID=94029 RepID=UPI002494D511|nr:uncharacterized protein LOC129958953 [Argiope bruennichi]